MTTDLDPRLIGFILYCTRERRDWPHVYDEMCRVAGQGLYQGLHFRDLTQLGFSFSLSRLGRTREMIDSVTRSGVGSGPLHC